MRGLHKSVDIMCLAQFLLFSFSFISFTCSSSGGLTQFFFVVVLIFPVLDRSVGQRLPGSEPLPRFVCFLVGSFGI